MSQPERIFYLLSCFREGKKVLTSELAERFEVSGRSVRRDIEYIRDRFRIQIEYSKGVESGYCVSDVDRNLLLGFDLGEKILFLSLMKSISMNHFLFPVDYGLISKALKVKDHKSVNKLTDRISYVMSEEKSFDISLFNCLIRSIEMGRQVSILYSNLNGEVSFRDIEPQYLRNSDGQWYLLAFCHVRGELRIFHISRIIKWVLLETKSVRVYSNEELVAFFDTSFGIMTGFKTVQNVSILFRNKAVRLVSEKQWHRDQEIELVDDGIILSFPVHSYEEILRIVLSYHSDAEVLAPVEFRELWKEKIREMAELFL